MTPVPIIHSRKVTRILALEARARRLLTRYERALEKAVRTKTEVHRVLDQANGIEWTLTGAQLSELYRGRGERGPKPAHPGAPPAPPSSLTSTKQ